MAVAPAQSPPLENFSTMFFETAGSDAYVALLKDVRSFADQWLSWEEHAATISFRSTRAWSIEEVVDGLTALLNNKNPNLDTIELSPSGRKVRIIGPDVPMIAAAILKTPPSLPPSARMGNP